MDSLEFNYKDCDFKCATEKGLITHTRMKHKISQLDGAADEYLLDTETHYSNLKVSKEEDVVNKEEILSMKEITDKMIDLEVEKVWLNELAKKKGFKDTR